MVEVFLSPPAGPGSGSALPSAVLWLSGISTVFATFVSAMSIYLHLKNYRKPLLQRMVIRIMIMVPVYGIASLIALFSLEAAFVIDAIRDIYEAFVIYCFFNLLLGYLGGERSLLILLHGREPKASVFPASLFKKEFDVSDPYTFLFLKRGILQYVQVKPILAIATLILKAVGKYNEGDLRANSGYLYISIVYNASICLSLYCLAMFWLCINEDLKPFRPMPKFLCVKGILFFSFWQSIFVSILVAAGAIRRLGPYTDSEHISLGLTDMLICFEMPIFAVAHMYAFSHTDYIDHHTTYAARMPMYYALRDAFGLKDVIEDTKATLRGEGMDYREFEPAEGFIHQGSGRDRRIKAGLRYSQGGKNKYWLPMPAESAQERHPRADAVGNAVRQLGGRTEAEEEGYAPLMEDEAEAVYHTAPDLQNPAADALTERHGFELPFEDPDAADEVLFAHSRKYLFGDYHYPCIDVSSERARKTMWDEEERVLRNERGAYFSPIRRTSGLLVEGRQVAGYGAVSHSTGSRRGSVKGPSGTPGAATKGKGRQNGDRHLDEQDENPAVIDREHDRIPDLEDGLRLGWTKHATRSPNAPHTPNLHPHYTPSPPRSPVAAPREGRSWEKAPSPMPSPRAESKRADLPPDAVDLVVEDNQAAEEEMTKERRKGEPAMRGSGLRRVFAHGYFVPDAHQSAEDTQEAPSDGDGSAPHQTGSDHDGPYTIGGSDDDDAVSERTVEVADAEVARAVTPPPYAQIEVDKHDVPLHDENPWA